MSMTLVLHRTDGAAICELLAKPALIHRHMAAYHSWYTLDDGELGADDYIPTRLLDSLDLGKAWHGLHFLLSGTTWSGTPPLDFLLAGGQIIGDEDLGYGPARGLLPEEVQEIHSALSDLSEPKLWSRFKPRAFTEAEIYPGGWNDLSVKEDFQFLLEHFMALKEFLGRTTSDDRGLVLCVI